MSDVESVGEAGGAGEPTSNSQQEAVIVTQSADGDPSTTHVKMVAPALRVEVLKDDGHSSSYYDSADDHSHGDGSDVDGRSSSPHSPEFVPPDEDLKDKIIKQVEFYFSDANILKDAFLLKHVRRNKQGYVSLKLITSFKKVKSMTKDYRVVAYSLHQSEKLEVNEEGTKVRRKDPLPDWDETTPSRTVVAVNLPFQNPTFENVSELFSKCGEVELIRILKPGKTIPPDVKKHINRHPELGTTVCAIVEFSQHDSAKKACEAYTNDEDWRKGMRVVLLAQKKEKDKNDKKIKAKQNSVPNNEERPDSAKSGDEGKEERNRKKKGGRRKNSRVDELAKEGESPCYSSGSDAEGLDPSPPGRGRSNSGPVHSTRSSLSPKPDPHRLSPSTTPKTSPRNSPRSSPRTSPTMRRRNMHHGRSPLAQELSPGTSPKVTPNASPETRRRREAKADDSAGSSPSSPWVQRRLKAAQAEGSPLAGNSPGQSPRLGRRLADLEGVIRQPRGPDGTKGFLQGIGRGKFRSETV